MTQIDKDNTTESNIGKTKRHTSVNNVIRLAKTKGLIMCVAIGEYVVNKT